LDDLDEVKFKASLMDAAEVSVPCRQSFDLVNEQSNDSEIKETSNMVS